MFGIKLLVWISVDDGFPVLTSDRITIVDGLSEITVSVVDDESSDKVNDMVILSDITK